ncbi:MAG: metallophosphoesterase, partial [Candidatus Thorarchaeota archaeon]
MGSLRLLLLSDIHGNIDAVKRLLRARLSQKDKLSGIVISGDIPATIPFSLVSHYIIRWRNLSRVGYSSKVYKGPLREKFIHYQLRSIALIIPLLEKFSVPIYFISGNVETKESINFIRKNFSSINFIEKNPVLIDNTYLLSGVGGSLEHLGILCDHEYSLNDYNNKIMGLQRKLKSYDENFQNIMIFHEPPKFTRNKVEIELMSRKARKRGYTYKFLQTAGSEESYKLIKEINPLLVINGHYHEYCGIRKIKNTIVVNPGPLATYNYAIIEILDKIKYKRVYSRFFKIKNYSY